MADRSLPSSSHLYAVGQDIGGAAIVRVYNESGTDVRDLSPFPAGFTGGVRVATGDVTGDGVDDIVAAAGPGGGPEVKVYDGATGDIVRDFFAYESRFRGGVNVAVGDVTGDGKDEIVTGTGIDGGPNVKVFDGATGGTLDSFFAYESRFRGGVNVAVGDVTGDGKADVVTGTGVGGGPRVQVFDGATGAEIGNFFAYDSAVRNGVTVAVGDLNGTGNAEIVTGVGPGGGPNVRVFDGASGGLAGSFFAYDPTFLGGVSVDVVSSNGANAILTTPGPSYGGFAELFDGGGDGKTAFEPFPGFEGGITTGQGLATRDAPFNGTFVRPLAPAGLGSSGVQSTDDENVYGTYSGVDTTSGSNSNFDTNTTTAPPIDPGNTTPPDTGSSFTDTGSDWTDTGGNSSGAWGGDCGCDDTGGGDWGGSGAGGDTSDDQNF